MKIFIEHIKFNIQCITCILLSKKMIKHCFHFETYNTYSSQQLKGLIDRLIDWDHKPDKEMPIVTTNF